MSSFVSPRTKVSGLICVTFFTWLSSSLPSAKPPTGRKHHLQPTTDSSSATPPQIKATSFDQPCDLPRPRVHVSSRTHGNLQVLRTYSDVVCAEDSMALRLLDCTDGGGVRLRGRGRWWYRISRALPTDRQSCFTSLLGSKRLHDHPEEEEQLQRANPKTRRA